VAGGDGSVVENACTADIARSMELFGDPMECSSPDLSVIVTEESPGLVVGTQVERRISNVAPLISLESLVCIPSDRFAHWPGSWLASGVRGEGQQGVRGVPGGAAGLHAVYQLRAFAGRPSGGPP
jgi:hypothetical protein